MELYTIVLSIIVFLFVLLLTNNIKIISVANILVSAVNLVVTIFIINKIRVTDEIYFLNKIYFIDAFSTVQLLIISSVTLISALYSYKYILNEVEHAVIKIKRAKLFYLLFNLFVLSMYLIAFSNNVMSMWISLEATTLATAFLIGFNRDRLSLEAAWKYIILCSIGIAFGLIGIILLIYSTGMEITLETLNWTYLSKHYFSFDMNMTKIAFTFIFVGIGTKAGFAPMHTWLSDGHSEAPSPISAMMSGILLNLALYIIIRFFIIVKLIDSLYRLKYLFILFGIGSLIISSFSILKQSNYKRLLAFSSVENIGIVSLGIGFGGYLGLFAAILHSIIHAFGKAMLFLTAGNLLDAYKTKRMDKINNLIKTMPINSFFLLLGMLIITGTPPFASFFSEYNVLLAGIYNGNIIAASVYALCILIVFAGFLNAFMKMIFSRVEGVEYKRLSEDKQNILPLTLAAVFVILISISFNSYLNPLIEKSTKIIGF